MNRANLRLIVAREVRDQLRDRRTLFVIVVLPLLLYPLLGMIFFQISQFIREQPMSVLVVGFEETSDAPPLVENQYFSPGLFSNPAQYRLLELHFARSEPGENETDKAPAIVSEEEAREEVLAGRYDAALFFPADFANRLSRLDVPQPGIIYTTANEKSQIAFVRLFDVLRRWREEISRENLIRSGVPPAAVKPFEVSTSDIAKESGISGMATWAKILPVMLLIWALTGAFYPAIDLCAGEKERGTLETLLCSPA